MKKSIDDYPYATKELLMNHAKSIGKPTEEYYHKLFNTEVRDCYNIRKMAEAAQIFNHLILQDI